MKEEMERTEELYRFRQNQPRLRAFDPFAGVGAFALGLQQALNLSLTHAIEISPSAAATIR